MPSVMVRMYKAVPPTRMGNFPFWKIFSIALFALNWNSPALNSSSGYLISMRWCGTIRLIIREGLAVPILRYLYTCIESAETISPFSSLAKEKATSVFPEAVGPSKTIIGFRIFEYLRSPSPFLPLPNGDRIELRGKEK